MLDKIKNNLVLIFAILIVCISFFLGKSCHSNKYDKLLKPKIDTIIVHHRDTIFPVDTFIMYKFKPSKGKIDTVYKPIYLDSTECNRVFLYRDSLKNKDYDIYSKAYVQGIFRELQLNVKLKVPLVIYDSTKTVIKKDSLIYKPCKYEVHVGLLASPKLLAPIIDFSIDKYTYSVGYDPFNKQPIIGFKYRIFGWSPKNK